MTITYARAGGPPDNWMGLRVFNIDTGKEMLNVHEVDAEAGWLVQYVVVDEKAGTLMAVEGQLVLERVDGNFRIEDGTLQPSGS